MAGNKEIVSRRDFLKGAGVVGAIAAFGGLHLPEGLQKEVEAVNLPYENGKYQTFPYQFVEVAKTLYPVFQDIDLGTLGPDVDTIFGLDFEGDIATGAFKIYQPTDKVEVTRVIGIKRTDLETVQFSKALGGDRFDVYQISKYGGDPALDAMARKHAENTARLHTKVVYVGDLGLFEKQWGAGEKNFLNTIIRAQRPGRPDLGIPDSNFVSPRIF